MKKTLILSLLLSSLSMGIMAKKALPIKGIAHVAFQVKSLEKSRAFYTAFYGFEFAFATYEDREAWYLKINDDQFLKLVSMPEGTDNNRLVEVAFEVSSIEKTTAMLIEKGLNPASIEEKMDGTLASFLIDPNGHKLLFVEYTSKSKQACSKGQFLGLRRVSDRLEHVGITIKNEKEANELYSDILGLNEIWRGSRKDGGPDAWVNMQMPGERGDYIEYILVNDMKLSRKQIGTMHHVCYLINDIQKAHQDLLFNALPDIERYEPMFGRSNRWLLNVHDPDGTRSELMESKEPINQIATPKIDFTKDSPTVKIKASPRFYGARIGALPRVKQGIALGDTHLLPAYEVLLTAANEALLTKPLTVTDKKRHPISGNLNDYYTQAPYLWPDLSKSDGLPYLPKDGVINPESRNPDFVDYSRGQKIGHLVETLSLAYYFTGEEAYAAQAAKCLRVWFIDSLTRMTPHLNYAQVVPGRNEGRYIGMIEAGGVVQAVDAAGLLDGSIHWKIKDRKALEVWIADFLYWFINSEYGKNEVQMRQNHGTMFDTRVVRLALALGKQDLARKKLQSVRENRIALQIEPDGAQPMELRRTKSFNYSEMNLTGLAELATLGEWIGVDLWKYETEDGRSIQKALEFLRPYVKEVSKGCPPRFWHYEHIVPFKPEILAQAFRMASRGYKNEEYESIVSQFASLKKSRFQLTHPALSF